MKLSFAGKGRRHSDEAKAKMSEKQKGRYVSDETKAKLSKVGKGKRLSDEINLKYHPLWKVDLAQQRVLSFLKKHELKCQMLIKVNRFPKNTSKK